MKKVFLAIAVASVFTACNSGESTEAPKTDTVATPAVDTTVKVADTTVKVADTTVKVADTAVKK